MTEIIVKEDMEEEKKGKDILRMKKLEIGKYLISKSLLTRIF
jgi:hypothetical protein